MIQNLCPIPGARKSFFSFMTSHIQLMSLDPTKTMASDRGQNRQSDFVASESLIVVVFLSSWRDLRLFVSSSFPVSSHCFLRGVISVSSCRQVSRFVVLLSSWRRRLLCFVVLFSSWRHSSLRVVVFFVSSTTV